MPFTGMNNLTVGLTGRPEGFHCTRRQIEDVDFVAAPAK